MHGFRATRTTRAVKNLRSFKRFTEVIEHEARTEMVKASRSEHQSDAGVPASLHRIIFFRRGEVEKLKFRRSVGARCVRESVPRLLLPGRTSAVLFSKFGETGGGSHARVGVFFIFFVFFFFFFFPLEK